MNVSLPELIGYVGGAGGIGAFLKWIAPFIKDKMKNNSDEKKLEMKLKSDSKSEVLDMWKERYEEEKEENLQLKLEIQQIREEKELAMIKFTKMREKWLNSENLKSHGDKDKKPK